MSWTTSVVRGVVVSISEWKAEGFLAGVGQVLIITTHTFRLWIAVGSCMTKTLATKTLDSLFVYSRLFDFGFSVEQGFKIKIFFVEGRFQIDKNRGRGDLVLFWITAQNESGDWVESFTPFIELLQENCSPFVTSLIVLQNALKSFTIRMKI